MSSQTKENYLKALYHLHQRNSDISITDLGKEMAVSKPTVNDMVKKFQVQGWVEYQKYKPLKLTEAGIREAAIVIRKHRLSEMFLSQVMSFGWEEVHDIAEELEHLKSDAFFDRMDELLGFPTNDPHGSPIPDKEGNFERPNYQQLSQVAAGQTVILRAIRDSSLDFLNYLNKKDIRLGIEITIQHIESFDKSITVSYHAGDVMLSHTVGEQLLVEAI